MADVCGKCQFNECDECLNSINDEYCDCSHSNHTLAAAVLVRDAIDALSPERSRVEAGTVETRFDGDADCSGFVLRINGREINVYVR